MLDYQGLLNAQRMLQLWIVGPGQWRDAAMSLALDGSPEAAEVLARQYARAWYPQLDALDDALRHVPDGTPLVRVWMCWEEMRNDRLAAALACRPPYLPCPVRVFVLASLKTGHSEHLTGRPMRDIVQELLAATVDVDPDIANRSMAALKEMANHPVVAEELALALMGDSRPAALKPIMAAITHAAAVQAVCTVWARSRHARLLTLLAERRWMPPEPPTLALLMALKFQPDIVSEGPELAGMLLRACRDPDPDVRRQAEARFSAGAGGPWRDAVCQAVIDEDCPPSVIETLSRRKWAPRDPEPRAVYFLLTDQFDKAEDLDFDQSILSDAYRKGTGSLRRRIAAAIRRSRRPDLIRILIRRQGDDYQHLLLPDAEWEVVLSALDAPDRAEELWSLALDAPPRWSVEAIGSLIRYGYQPTDVDRPLFEKLVSQDVAQLRSVGWDFLEGDRQPETGTLPGTDGKAQSKVRAVALHHRVAIAEGSQASICQGESRQPLTVEEPRGAVLSLVWSSDGRRLAVARLDEVEIWDVDPPQLVRRVSHCAGEVIAFAGHGKRLVTQSRYGYRQYWHVESGRQLSMDEGKGFSHAALSADGGLLAIVRSDEWRLYEVDIDRAVDAFRLLRRETMQSAASDAAFSPDGRFLATVAFEGLKIHDVLSGELKHVMSGRIFHLAWSGDARYLGFELGFSAADRRVALFDTLTGTLRVTFPIPQTYRNTGTNQSSTPWTRALWISPDNQFMLAFTANGALLRWHLCATPLAALHLLTWEAQEKRSKVPTDPRWSFLAALLEYRRRYDIEIEEDVFVPDEFDIELETTAGVGVTAAVRDAG